MSKLTEELQALDIPHTSYMEAVRHMREEYNDISIDHATELLKTITNTSIPPLEDKLVFLTLLYVIQEGIRDSFINTNTDSGAILGLAIDKASQLIETNPWMFVEPDEEELINEMTGKPVMKKGKKQELAAVIYEDNRTEDKEVIMDLFQKELDMSKSGARTYYYNMRNKFGDNK